jgi:hypothetical protein
MASSIVLGSLTGKAIDRLDCSLREVVDVPQT